VSVPEVPQPPGVRTPIDVRLKAAWSYDPDARTFTSVSGETFALGGLLPKGTKVVHKTPQLARRDASTLSAAERDLRRYLQVILPVGESPAAYVARVRKWPPVERADLGPDVSLPRGS
jgi:hypothetical protein